MLKKYKSIIFLLFANCAFAQSPHKIFINEFLASNVSNDADIVDFDDYSDWIELYNDEDFDVDIGGYFLTDDFDNPMRWEIPANTILPAKSFLRFWADGYNDKPGNTYSRPYLDKNLDPIYFTTKYYHLNFKLSRAGEQIGLFDQAGSVVDSISFGLQLRDVSMGRYPDGADDWFYFSEPTAGKPNNTQPTKNTEYSQGPEIDLPSGLYGGNQLVNIFLNDEIKTTFTLNGSKPFYLSDSLETGLTITNNTILRSRNFENDKLASPVITRSYFVDEETLLPVISIAAPPKSLWDDKVGIYENNFKQREIPIYFEYFEKDGRLGFAQNAGLRLTGQASLYYGQKSFTITARERYGKDEFNFQVFADRELNSFKTLYLRNAGYPDNQNTFFRDGLAARLVQNKMDIDVQAYSPAVVFINGEYWGIYNIRDKINAEYLASIHNINPDDIDLLEYTGSFTPEVMEGNANNYNEFFNFIDENDLTITENYYTVENWMDIDEYINYQICEIFYDNVIWPAENMRMWRERKHGKKWRWILHDIDFGLGMPNLQFSGFTNNTLRHATSSKQKDNPPPWSTLIFRKLLQNDDFRIKFIQAFSTYLNTVFHPDTTVTKLNMLRSNIDAEMPRHISRWRNESGYGNPIPDYFTWLGHVDRMRQFVLNRPEYQREHIEEYFGLPGQSEITFEISEPGSGTIRINSMASIKEEDFHLYFKGVPLKLQAIPNVGFRFVKWSGVADSLQNSITVSVDKESMTIQAIFEPVTINTIPSVVSSNLVLASINSPYYASTDILIDSSVTLRVEEGVEIMMPEEASFIVCGNLLIEGTEQKPVTIQPNENSQSWGAISFVNASDSSILNYLNIAGATKGPNFERDRAAISGHNSSFTLNNVKVNNSLAPVFARFGKVSIKNSYFTMDISGDLINIIGAKSALVENCEFKGNNEFDTDAIDFDQVENGVIRNNRIYNFYGFNSDAIDLGEGSKNILVENNIIYNIQDKGISIGHGSTATIKRNLILNCDMGIGIKDFDSFGYVEHNTFYGNNYSIACFEKNIGEGGGSAEIVNSILANSKSASILVDLQSSVLTSYTLSNTDIINGEFNIKSEPGFLNNLRLTSGSSAINKGNPDLPSDPDGSLPDLGAFPFSPESQHNLVINEIHYNPLEGPDYQFIEIINVSAEEISIDNLQLSGDVTYTFPAGKMDAGEICIIAKDAAKHQGNSFKVYQWDSGALSTNDGAIFIKNEIGNFIDFVNYDSRYWWPERASGSGSSLELHATSLENMVSSSWRASYISGGSPGEPNNAVVIDGLYINEFLASNSLVNVDEFGENDDWIEIYNANPWPVNTSGLFINDNFSRTSKYLIPFSNPEKTIVPANGYLLFWADGQPEQGPLHLNFKLAKLGEQIAIAQLIENDTLLIDSLTYSEQTTDISYGRTPDGSITWDYFSNPTPYASNKATSIKAPIKKLIHFSLSQNYPNPFNPVTTIEYTVRAYSAPQHIELSIYNILGQKVATLVNKKQPAGNYKVIWDASSFASGIYIYRLETSSSTGSGNKQIKTKKLILLK
ncbi:MAG: T9SS C-terminal target domain-containing protein [Calditrichaeota bacterium]|nr:MAG: T9SS C-terminal target domain-containing protein [Calditrichota bacterium]MBL1204134.1 T9SS C-terminal target domain-containing protein [Calditrichota bacterium]NOG43965.1 T9SS type A sorting domain-containing protein [Calditrichota bacterium]